MDDWQHRILGALRHSKILLVCLSPDYFRSPYCRWEWDEYLRRQVHQLMGAESVALHVFVYNTTAFKLYKRMGYEVTNINMRKEYA